MNRRELIKAAGGSIFTARAAAVAVLDAHIHLFDPRRKEGIPWPEPKSPLYRPALPDRYRQIAAPLGVRGAIVVEASPRYSDNQWVLDTAAADSIIKGFVGNLEPGKPEFPKRLEALSRNRLFRGIRYGNLWGRDLGAELGRPEFVSGLRLLSEAGLSLDTANQDAALIHAVLRLTDEVPALRVIIDHLPQMTVPAGEAGRQVRADLRELGARPQVFVKLSEVFRRVDGAVPREISHYRGWLDEICSSFGDDRVLFGSDWPNSDQWRPFGDVLALMQEYFAGKSPSAAEHYFAGNAQRAYRVTI
jgi:predicted TIM-barrel fold metal-dependent hydrolase